MQFKRNSILIASVVVEGVLAILFLIWTELTGYTYDILPSLTDFKFGLLCCLPLFFVNYLLFGPLADRLSKLRSFYYFKDSVVRPLAAELDFVSAAVIALCAGVGEELFFRGFVQTELGLPIASILFSLLHFGPAVRNFLWIAILYIAIGFYFGFIRDYFESLWVPVITHVVYDYVALLYMRYLYRSRDSALDIT